MVEKLTRSTARDYAQYYAHSLHRHDFDRLVKPAWKCANTYDLVAMSRNRYAHG